MSAAVMRLLHINNLICCVQFVQLHVEQLHLLWLVTYKLYALKKNYY